MASDVRRETLALLAEVWDLSPDIRLGQLLAHLGFLGEAHLGRGLGDIEDDEIMAILQRHKSELDARLQGAPMPAPSQAAPDISISGGSMLPNPAR
jgi:uncharacterized protein YihD (DUF1040 family)